MWDVIVVGGSVAGATTALSLSKHGIRVLLLEKQPLGRDKACGEGLLPAGVDVLRRLGAFSTIASAKGEPFYGVGFEFEGQSARARFPSGHAFGVRRKLFDQALFSLAAEQTLVTAKDNALVQDLLFSSSGQIIGVKLSKDERVYARLVIAADGLHSSLRAKAGLDLGLPKRKRYGIRAHFQLKESLPFGSYVHVLIDPPGEFYLTPVGPNTLQVAFLGEDLRKRGFHATSFAKCVLDHSRLGPLLSGAHCIGTVKGAGPFYRKARSVVKHGFALVGDAAGYVDAVTGEGMELALRSAEVLGEIAAKALSQGNVSANTLAPYARKREQIVSDPEKLTRLVLLLERFPTLARRGIRALQKNPKLFEKLLSIQGGEAAFSSISLREIFSLLAG